MKLPKNWERLQLDRLDDNDVGLRISGPWPTSSLHWSYLATSLISGLLEKTMGKVGMFFLVQVELSFFVFREESEFI